MTASSPGREPRSRRVLLTGATGNWGRATLREFRRHPEFDVVALSRPTRQDRAALAEFDDMPNLRVEFGDLTRYDDVARALDGVDVVLHVAAVVSPLADARPDLARRVNLGSLRNIITAVRRLSEPGSVAVVGVGSVAETGDRPVPFHWGRVGDPLRVSRFDEYGHTKVQAERMLVDSGLPRWAWLRQTGILHPGMLQIRDPIMTHTPLAGVLEWVSAEDSARLLVGAARADVPEEFWGGIYNVGGGEGWRLTNWQLHTAIAEALGVEDVRGWFDPRWFALKNFHGQWFTDSDRLQELVPFRGDTLDAALARGVAELPVAARQAGKIPAWVIKHFVMRRLAHQPRGTMHAIRRRDDDAISAYFGSRGEWKAIGDWSRFEAPTPSRTPRLLDHGYDEDKAPSAWTRADYEGVARFRGGVLLSDAVATGDVATPLTWRCGFEHTFAGSPRLILTAGHWCPECGRDSAGYARQAELNRFLAQLETAA